MVQASLIRPPPATAWLLWLASLHVAALVVGHVLGSKSAELGPFLVTLTLLSFPFTFLSTDLVNEYFGPNWARRLSAAGLGSVALAYLLIEVARIVPTETGSHLPPGAFDHVMSTSFVHPVALISGYVFGQFVDVGVFHRVRELTGGHDLWKRVLLSTTAGEAVDGVVVTAFALLAPTAMLGSSTPLNALKVTWDQATLRVAIVIVMLPVLYLIHVAQRPARQTFGPRP